MIDYKKLSTLNGKNIIVCGGSGLIGKQVVEACEQHGANVVVADIVKPEVCNNYSKFDLSSESSVSDSFKKIADRYIDIDGWINLAYPKKESWGLPITEINQDSWDWHISTHLGGYFWTNRIVLEYMKEKKKGSMINFSSIYGVVGPNFSIYENLDMGNPPGYAAIKGGIVNLTRYFATYYGKNNVRVNCISPGGIYDGQNSDFVDRYNKLTPLKRMGRPEDIAGACVFLMSDASSYITGHNLLIDGGWCAQ